MKSKQTNDSLVEATGKSKNKSVKFDKHYNNNGMSSLEKIEDSLIEENEEVSSCRTDSEYVNIFRGEKTKNEHYVIEFSQNIADDIFEVMEDMSHKNNKDTLVIIEYPHGVNNHIFRFKNGKKHGKSYSFYEDGSLKKMTTYSRGYKNGPCKEYFENGILSYYGEYCNDKLHKTSYCYNTDGKIIIEETYDSHGYADDVKFYNENIKKVNNK